jgi:hypothetical protein
VRAAAIQQAVFARLNNASVTSLLSAAYSPIPAIFTDVPQAADSGDATRFPFVTIGDDAIQVYDTKDQIGGVALIQIDVWARASSKLAINAIADVIDLRMRRQSLLIANANHIDTVFESLTPLDDPDGKTKRIMLRYRVLYLED